MLTADDLYAAAHALEYSADCQGTTAAYYEDLTLSRKFIAAERETERVATNAPASPPVWSLRA